VVVALIHPLGSGDPYEFLEDKVGLWVGVHFAQLVLALALAMVVWTLLAGRVGRAATVARAALPVWLVAFTTFDAVTGLGSVWPCITPTRWRAKSGSAPRAPPSTFSTTA
jgi:hypothetical protein